MSEQSIAFEQQSIAGLSCKNIFDHVEDGILILDLQGNVSYFNPSAAQGLGLQDHSTEKISINSLFQWEEKANDLFCQYLLDCIYEKNRVHTGTVPYILPSREKKILQVRASFWSDPEQEQNKGILMIFQDHTQQEELKRQRREAVTVFNGLLACVCFWVVLIKAMESFNIVFTPFIMSYLLIGIGLVTAFYQFRKANLSSGELGLSTEKLKGALISNSILTLICIAIMALAKYVMIRSGSSFFPEGQPFWYFRIDSISMKLYPVSVFLQEFIARGVIFESLLTILDDKHKFMKATFISAMMFAALHIHRGFAYMAGAFLLIALTSPLYIRHRNIYGLCIFHYAVSTAAVFLGFF